MLLVLPLKEGNRFHPRVMKKEFAFNLGFSSSEIIHEIENYYKVLHCLMPLAGIVE